MKNLERTRKRFGAGLVVAIALSGGTVGLLSQDSGGHGALLTSSSPVTRTADVMAGAVAPRGPAYAERGAGGAAGTTTQSSQGQASGVVTLTTDRATGVASTIRVSPGGDLYPQVSGAHAPAAKVTAFLAGHRAAFGIKDPAAQLRLLSVRKDQYGHHQVNYGQVHRGVPVLGAVLRGHVSPDGRLTAVNGKFVPDVAVPSLAQIARDQAQRTALARVRQGLPTASKGVPLVVRSASLAVYRAGLAAGRPGRNHLVYEVQVTGGTSVREFVYVDAVTGTIVDQITGIHGVKDRRVYEGSFNPGSPELPPPVWREGDGRPAAHPSHEDEVSGAGYAYNLFFNLSGGTYRSWDGGDAPMITVNNDPTIVCPNANWNGTSTNYCLGTSADDVVVHEWTHAYTQETSGLIYTGQSGALNESYSDIFGETADLLNNRETIAGATPVTGDNGPRSQDDAVCSTFNQEIPTSDNSIRWLVAEDAYAFSPLPPIGDAAIRDMWRPRCSGGNLFAGDPGHASSPHYHCSDSDNGGVHTNSAINNRAYALLVDGDTVELKDDGDSFPDPVTVTGIGLTKAAHIFWRANSVYNGPASNFENNADALEMSCSDLVGANLTKLVTDGEDGTGPLGANDDTLDPGPQPSGEIITNADCIQVTNAIAAVEMRHDVAAQCGSQPLLNSAPTLMGAGSTKRRTLAVVPAGRRTAREP